MKKLLLFMIPVIMIITACGGGGGSSSGGDTGGDTEPTTKKIGGIVSDPAISGAVVELRLKSDDSVAVICGTTGSVPCKTFTDEDGLFDMILPIGADLTAYYIKSFGGVDTVTNINMESFSFESPIEAFSENTDNIVVSPVTTIMRASSDTTVAGMKAHARSVLGLSDTADPAADPATDGELFKKSYMLITLASTYRDMLSASGSSTAGEPFSVISAVTLSGALFTADSELDDTSLTEIYKSFAGNDGYDDDIDELKSTAVSIEDVDSTGDVVAALIDKEINRLFKVAVMTLADDTPVTVTDTFIANIEAYVDAVQSLSEGLAADRFMINQIARYTMLSDYGLTSYADFTADTFSASLSAMIADDAFGTAVTAVLESGPTYIVSVPLSDSDLPGDDNAKRAAYYYNSNLDVGYKARKLASDIKDDDLNDDINLVAVRNYAEAGLNAKAKSIADSLIVKTLNQVNAYRNIAKNNTTLGGDLAESVTYLQKAESLIRGLHDTATAEPFTTSEAKELADIMKEYMRAGDLIKAASLESYMDTVLADLDESKKGKAYSAVVSAFNAVVKDDVENGELDNVEAMTDKIVKYVDNLSLGTTEGKIYATQLVFLQNALIFYNAVGASQKVVDTYHNIIKDMITFDSSSGKTNWEFYASKMTGPLYRAGDSSAAMDLLGSITKSNYASYAAESIIVGVYKDDFDEAVSIYEAGVPMDTDFDNIADYISSWTYLASNRNNPGIAMYALNDGLNDLAEKAVDYAESKMDAAVQYFKDNDSDFAEYLVQMVTSQNRFYETGYVKNAYLYNELGLKTKALASIQKAIDYADLCVDSVNKATAYSTIAYYAMLIDPAYDASPLFAKARTVFDNASGDTAFSNDNLFNIKFGIADDYILQGDTATALLTMEEAVNYAELTHQPGVGTEEDKAVVNESENFRKLAEWYYTMQDMGKAKLMLEKSAAVAPQHSKASSVSGQYKQILQKYAQFGLYDLGYEKAKVMFPVRGDFIKGMEDFIGAMLNVDDFDKIDVASRDLDKDGKPDFFHLSATAEEIAASGLVLDDDTDGDGVADVLDTTPFYAD